MNKYIIVPWGLLATFTPLGILFIHLAIKERSMGEQSLSWPVVAGMVESAEVVSSSDDGSTSYSPRIAYRYCVDSNEYWSKRIRYAAIGGGDYAETKAVVDRYVTGKQVSVYYNPGNPSDSVLEPGAFGRSWGLLIGGLLFAGVGFGVWLFRRKIEAYELRREALIEHLENRHKK